MLYNMGGTGEGDANIAIGLIQKIGLPLGITVLLVKEEGTTTEYNSSWVKAIGDVGYSSGCVNTNNVNPKDQVCM